MLLERQEERQALARGRMLLEQQAPQEWQEEEQEEEEQEEQEEAQRRQVLA
jgi:hypothetical protein